MSGLFFDLSQCISRDLYFPTVKGGNKVNGRLDKAFSQGSSVSTYFGREYGSRRNLNEHSLFLKS